MVSLWGYRSGKSAKSWEITQEVVQTVRGVSFAVFVFSRGEFAVCGLSSPWASHTRRISAGGKRPLKSSPGLPIYSIHCPLPNPNLSCPRLASSPGPLQRQCIAVQVLPEMGLRWERTRGPKINSHPLPISIIYEPPSHANSLGSFPE
jgi:hypothetical protein